MLQRRQWNCHNGGLGETSRRFRLPYLPGHIAAGMHVFQELLILKCVHRRPESVVSIGCQLTFFDQSLKRLFDQFRFTVQVIKDLILEHIVAAIDSYIGGLNILDRGHGAAILDRNEMIAQVRLYIHKRRYLSLAMKEIDNVG